MQRVVARGQSQVVGVALLLGLTVVAVGTMTVAVGDLVDRRADATATAGVAGGFTDALEPHIVGPNREHITTPEGRIRTVDREIRLLEGDVTQLNVDAGALVYTAGDQRVGAVGGVVTRGAPEVARARTQLPVRSHRGGLVADVVVLGAGGVDITRDGVVLRTNVTHDRRRFDAGSYQLAVETATPDAVAAAAPDDAAVTVRDIDGDGIQSVVVEFSGTGPAVVSVHRLDLEVAAA